MKKDNRLKKLISFLKKFFYEKEPMTQEFCVGYQLTRENRILALILTEEGVQLKEVTEIRDLEKVPEIIRKKAQSHPDPLQE